MNKKYYLVLDTETATLPFVNEICKNSQEKKKISIAKPLIYDIAWILCDRERNIMEKKNYLVEEIFTNEKVFSTAYYKNKMKIYKNLLQNGKIEIKPWEFIVNELIQVLEKSSLAVAYNACFDFKKSIPFTDEYMENFYSPLFDLYLMRQKEKSKKIIEGKELPKNENYLKPTLQLRGKDYPIADLWGLTCKKLININKYKDFCLENDLLTDGKIYFKTSAETSFQYLMNQKDFEESHTALDDTDIESLILKKILKKGKIEAEIESFPFKILGTSYDYVLKNKKHEEKVKEEIRTLAVNTAEGRYKTRLNNIVKKLEDDILNSKKEDPKVQEKLELYALIKKVIEEKSSQELTAKEILEEIKDCNIKIQRLTALLSVLVRKQTLKKKKIENETYYSLFDF